MSEQALQQYQKELQQMNKDAKAAVIIIASIIHLFLIGYTMEFASPFMKVLIPSITVLTILIMIVSGKYFDRHEK